VVVADIFRIERGKLVEHWDVLQNEVPGMAALDSLSKFDSNEDKHR
jgi:predicted SnoaL-like aldol condensation-catalyzing enzyme|tara:strand:+ start:5903 stop:6040 length:138 start_codon:yes stop_codon:yes gene_type:complete